LRVTASQTDALATADLVLIAVPSGRLRENAKSIHGSIGDPRAIISATKGLELESGKRMSEVLAEELPLRIRNRVGALSGPNLAGEIVQDKPASTVVASPNQEAAEYAQSVLNTSIFRVYTNTDVVGVELGGTLKNIIAISAGICDGAQYGDNAKAGIMTRGLAEIARLGVASGADPNTFAGLAGMGDLVATCSSALSRNHYVGVELAKGRSLTEIRSGMRHVAEGVDATAAAHRLAKQLGVEMPITQGLYQILFEGMSPTEAVTRLMGRAPAPE